MPNECWINADILRQVDIKAETRAGETNRDGCWRACPPGHEIGTQTSDIAGWPGGQGRAQSLGSLRLPRGFGDPATGVELGYLLLPGPWRRGG